MGFPQRARPASRYLITTYSANGIQVCRDRASPTFRGYSASVYGRASAQPLSMNFFCSTNGGVKTRPRSAGHWCEFLARTALPTRKYLGRVSLVSHTGALRAVIASQPRTAPIPVSYPLQRTRHRPVVFGSRPAGLIFQSSHASNLLDRCFTGWTENNPRPLRKDYFLPERSFRQHWIRDDGGVVGAEGH
jgi:hypothetical protein